jgi:uncharacterized protein (TIGR03790 family)
LVNSQDPQSVAVAAAYAQKRGIPANRIFTISAPVNDTMSLADFAAAQVAIDAQLDGGDKVEAFAMTWTRPYRVDCMSATTAFAAGFDAGFCNKTGMTCGATAATSYFNSESSTPWEDHRVRPTMMLAAANTANAIALIDRGVASDDTFPSGDVYLMRTTDTARSVRYFDFQLTAQQFVDAGVKVTYLDNTPDGGVTSLTNTQGVLGYMTGWAQVPLITTNTYLPGAFADHLTSYGGQVPTSGQMSVAAWLAAGATGSYGTVVEPCNYTAKFPRAAFLWAHYYRGETMVEAVWKSVNWPGEGNFVGEPLARPFGKQDTAYDSATQALTLKTNWPEPGKMYAIDSAPSSSGPWTQVQSGLSFSTRARQTVTVKPATSAYYRIVKRP